MGERFGGRPPHPLPAGDWRCAGGFVCERSSTRSSDARRRGAASSFGCAERVAFNRPGQLGARWHGNLQGFCAPHVEASLPVCQPFSRTRNGTERRPLPRIADLCRERGAARSPVAPGTGESTYTPERNASRRWNSTARFP